MNPYPREFYLQNACIVAQALIGANVVRLVDGLTISGRIVETEAYTGLEDQASHASGGKTPRNTPMWEAPGHAYIYLCYGMYWLFNVTCEPVGEPAAVLIRAVEPVEGKKFMAHRRPVPEKNWANGPGRLTRALAIDGKLNKLDLTTRNGGLWIAPGETLAADRIMTGARVGMGKNVPEPWHSLSRRWWLKDNPFVSFGG